MNARPGNVPESSRTAIAGDNSSTRGEDDHIDRASDTRTTTLTSNDKSPDIAKAEDPNLVTWDNASDPANPRNWTKRAKWTSTLVFSAFSFISPVSSSILAPAIAQMSEHYGVSKVSGQMMLSTFVLAYAVGPLITGPLSEIYGRVWVQQLWNILYLAFNTACIGAPNAHTLTAFRFMAGLGASAPFAVGGGVISDVWRADERGRATAVYTLVPLVGPALGAICGGFITHHAGWRYCFAVTSITNAVVVALSLVLLRETYPPTILHRKAQRLRTETGNLELHTAYERSTQSNTQYVMSAMVRPFRLLGTQPIVQILALLMGVFNGSLYLLLSTFPLLWHERYNEPVNLASLNYLSIGLGFFIGSQLSAFSQDRIYRRLSAHYDTEGRPEYRIPLMIPAAAVAPLGLLFFGWAAAERWHWIVPNVGALFFSFGVSIGFQAIQVYLIDAYPRYAASAVGAVGVLRSVGGFAFPLFGPELFERLEFGKGGSIVAGVLAAVGIPGALGLWVYGARLRASYRYAAGGGFDDG